MPPRRTVGIPYGSGPLTCPVRALATWRMAASVTDGLLFLSMTPHGQLVRQRLCDRGAALAVKRAAL